MIKFQEILSSNNQKLSYCGSANIIFIMIPFIIVTSRRRCRFF